MHLDRHDLMLSPKTSNWEQFVVHLNSVKQRCMATFQLTQRRFSNATTHKKVELFCFCNNFVKYKRNWIIFGMFLA